MWVDPITQCSFLQWVILIDPSQKNYDVFNTPQVDFINMEKLSQCFTLPNYIYYKNELLGKGYGTNCDVILGNNLYAHFGVHLVLPHHLVEFLFLTLFITIFWLGFYKSLVLIIMLISLIDCVAP
jgi:hypothetical protein